MRNNASYKLEDVVWLSDEVKAVLSEEPAPGSEDIWDRGEHISLDGREETLLKPPRLGVCEACGKEKIIVTHPHFPLCEACDGARWAQGKAGRRKMRKGANQGAKGTNRVRKVRVGGQRRRQVPRVRATKQRTGKTNSSKEIVERSLARTLSRYRV